LINLVPHLANKLLHDETTKQQLAPADVVSRLGGKVRLLQVGGAAIADALWYELERCGLPPLQGYGLTEASPVVCSNREGKQRPGTIGPPVAGVEVRVDADKQLWVRGNNVMCGYYRDSAATQARIQDGWLATGDLVEQDHLGHFRLLGRMSGVIVLSTGFKVSPELIESRLANIPCIERVLIVGQDKPYTAAMIWPAWSTLPAKLFTDVVQGRDSLELLAFYKDLGDFVGQQLSDLPVFMHPKKLILLSDSLNSDSEFVNPKGNLRRNVAITRLQSQIDKAYS
jgi:long-chain acyl-CoA synthetase